MYERFQKLYARINQMDDKDLSDVFTESVKTMLAACASYVELVSTQEQRIQVARFRMDGCNFRDFVENLDRSRRFAHNDLMAKVDLTNRICGRMGLEPIADVEAESRETYGDFALKVTNEYFKTAA